MVIDASHKAGYQQQQPELCAARLHAGTSAPRPGIVGWRTLSSLPLLQELAGSPCAITCDVSTYSFLLPCRQLNPLSQSLHALLDPADASVLCNTPGPACSC